MARKLWNRSPEPSGGTAGFVDSEGEALRLGASLGSGREGEVFEVAESSLVAKIFRPPDRTAERFQKLRLMLASRPEDPTQALGHVSIAWPSRLVFEKSDRFAGFLMPRVDIAGAPALLRFVFPRFYPPVFNWRHQLEIGSNLAGTLAALHEAGYVVGDLNLKNVHVTPACLVTFVDCDSFQVRDAAAGRTFRCLVGMPEYAAPEFQGVDFAHVDRSAASDSFAFAVVLCQLLLAGCHPFAGGRAQTREENIAAGDSIFARRALPRGTPPLEILPPALFDLLDRCFREGQRDPPRRPTMGEFARALAEARQQIVSCATEPERHAYGGHRAACPWCEHAAAFGFDPYRPKPRAAPAARAGSADDFEIQHWRPTPVAAAGARRGRPLRRLLWLGATAVLVFGLMLAGSALLARLDKVGTAIPADGGPLDLFGGARHRLLLLGDRLAALWPHRAAPAPPIAPASPAPAVAAPTPAAEQTAGMRIESLVFCFGLDPAGRPIRAGGQVSEADVRARPLDLYVRYRGATPGKTALQVRWQIGGTLQATSKSISPAAADGVILVPYRHPLPPGSHRVTLLADGTARRSASLVVLPAPAAPPAPHAAADRAVAPDAETAPEFAAATPEAPPAPPPVLDFAARHKHRIGACTGELSLEPETLRFVSPAHLFRLERKSLTMHEDGVEDATGRRWHFVIEGRDARRTLADWLRGGAAPPAPR